MSDKPVSEFEKIAANQPRANLISAVAERCFGDGNPFEPAEDLGLFRRNGARAPVPTELALPRSATLL